MLAPPACGPLAPLAPITVEVDGGPSKAERETEFYETPAWCVDRLLDRIGDRLRPTWHPWNPHQWDRWLDPCVGNGAIVDAVNFRLVGKTTWWTCDIRDTGRAQVVGDYRAIEVPDNDNGKLWDVSIMNPPFSLALEFVAKALEEARVVIMLQRLNWLGSEERQPWLKGHRPATFVLPNRPDFNGGGGDSQEYAWFVWGLGHCEIDILGLTPADIRKAQKPKRPPKPIARVSLGVKPRRVA